MSCSNGACGEVLSAKGVKYIFDAKDYESGPVAQIAEGEFATRLKAVQASRNPLDIFDGEQLDIALSCFDEAEVRALGACLLGAPDDYRNLADGESIIATTELAAQFPDVRPKIPSELFAGRVLVAAAVQ